MKKRDIAGEAGISISEQQKLPLPIIREIDRICRRHNLTYFLYFGSLLGAVRHGGFIPWDDDFDIMMPRADYWRFREIAAAELKEDFFLQSCFSDPHWNMLNVPLKVRDNNSTVIEEFGKRHHHGIYVDIFPADPVSDPKSWARLKKRCSRISSYYMPISLRQAKSPRMILRVFLQLIFRLIPPQLTLLYLEGKALRLSRATQAKRPTHIAVGLEMVEKEIYPLAQILPTGTAGFDGLELAVPADPPAVLTALYSENYMTPPPENDRGGHCLFYSDKRLNYNHQPRPSIWERLTRKLRRRRALELPTVAEAAKATESR